MAGLEPRLLNRGAREMGSIQQNPSAGILLNRTHSLPLNQQPIIMKNILILSLLLAAPALAGSSQIMTESSQPSVTQSNAWDWFIGGTAGYLLDYEEDMYTFQFGGNTPWVLSGWSVALFGEVGWTENHDSRVIPFGGNSDVDLVPMTFNAKFEHLITGGLSAYIGAGLGTTYIDADYSTPTGRRHTDDWISTAQIFAGLAYHVSDNFEIFGGARWIYFDDTEITGVSLDDDILVEGGLRFRF